MNTRNTVIAGFLAVSTAFFGIAQAKGPGCDGEGPMRGAMMRDGDSAKMSGRMQERMGQRLDKLHAELKLTAQQEPLWQAFAEKSKAEMGKGMQAMHDSSADTKLSAPERMDRMQTAMKDRLASMEAVNESFKRLYAALTPEQKAIADQQMQRMGHGGPQGGKGAGGPGAPKGNRDGGAPAQKG